MTFTENGKFTVDCKKVLCSIYSLGDFKAEVNINSYKE